MRDDHIGGLLGERARGTDYQEQQAQARGPEISS
jgi:hypothetical protein